MTCPKLWFAHPIAFCHSYFIRSPSATAPSAHLTNAQLKRFQLDPEEFGLAKKIYGHWVQVKTAPRSGHELGASVIAVPATAGYLACVQCVSIDRICHRVCVTELHLSIYSSDVDYNTAVMFPVSVRWYSGRCSELSRPHEARATQSSY